MNKTYIEKRINDLVEEIDKLKKYCFYDKSNNDDYVCELESAVVSLQDAFEVIERDEELKIMRSVT